MKVTVSACMLILLTGSLNLLITGCASTRIKELEADRFISQAEEMKQINSFHWTSYIGHTANRVYLEYQNPALVGQGLRSTVYWTELSGLPQDLQKQVQEGKNPWADTMSHPANSELPENISVSDLKAVK